MHIYSVGPDEPYGLPEDENFVWLVYWYQDGYYDGHGECVALHENGILYIHDLGHCSCYGPFEEFPGSHTMTLEEFFRKSENVLDHEFKIEIINKVKEITKDLNV